MKKLAIFVLVMLSVFVACRKDLDITETTIISPLPKVYVNTSIGGLVVDENNAPVINATVKIGAETTTTDKNGVFNFQNKVVDSKSAYIQVARAGYFQGSKTIMVAAATRNQVKIQLLSNQPTKYINAQSGGIADYSSYSVALPAGGIVTESGADYTGQVGVAAKWLDPSSRQLEDQMPGRLFGVRTDGQGSGLVSMGMLAVELTDASGNKLQIKKGFESTLRMKVPESLIAAAPATIPLWYFDEASGLWVEEGSASLANGYYEGKVKHFTFWNCDFAGERVEVNFKVIDTNGNPVEGIHISLFMTDSTYGGSGTTDNTGHVSGLIPKDELLSAYLYAAFGNCFISLQTVQIGPFSTPSDHTFTVEIPTAVAYSISGTLIDCNGNPVTNGYLHVFAGSNDLYGFTNAQGDFNINFISCTPLTDASFIAYDLDAVKESAITPVSFASANAVSIGNVTACTTIQSYISHTCNGLTYNYIGVNTTTYDSTANLRYITIAQYTSNDHYVNLTLVTDISAGTYQPYQIVVAGTESGVFINQGCYSTSCGGISVNVTENGGVGGYIGGTYSGTIEEYSVTPTATVTVSGTFRALLQ